MITGRWGKPDRILLDITAAEDGTVTGIANPGRENAPIRSGTFDAATGAVRLEGAHAVDGQPPVSFLIEGRLNGRRLELGYRFGEMTGTVSVVRAEEYRPPPLTVLERIEPYLAAIKRRISTLTRPTGAANRRRLRERGESLGSIVFRDATEADIPALAELHVTTWNATYMTTRGPTVATRAWQWTEAFKRNDPGSFVLVLEDARGRLVGFASGRPHRNGIDGFTGELSKIYLRWEYHGLGLGRRMMGHVARRFLDRGVSAFCLFAELSNPTLGFYDRMGGERLVDDRGRFSGAYGWRDAAALASRCPAE